MFMILSHTSGTTGNYDGTSTPISAWRIDRPVPSNDCAGVFTVPVKNLLASRTMPIFLLTTPIQDLKPPTLVAPSFQMSEKVFPLDWTWLICQAAPMLNVISSPVLQS